MERLTPRQREYLGARCAGMRYCDMAAHLCVEYNTVKNMMHIIFMKLRITDSGLGAQLKACRMYWESEAV